MWLNPFDKQEELKIHKKHKLENISSLLNLGIRYEVTYIY